MAIPGLNDISLMSSTHSHESDALRLRILRDLEILDTSDEEEFDDLTGMAARLFDVPVALITLIDEDRQWAKSRFGEFPQTIPRKESFCDQTIRKNDLLVVPDAPADPRFSRLPIVAGGAGIRFYAGAPLITREGEAVGALCVLDTKSRQATGDMRRFLRALARQAVLLLETRRRGPETAKARKTDTQNLNRELEQKVADRTIEFTVVNERLRAEIEKHERTEQSLRESETRFQAFMNDNPAVAWMKDGEGRYVYVNRTLTRVYGVPGEEVLGKTDWELLPVDVARQLRANDEEVFSSGRPMEMLERIPVAENDVHVWRIWKFPFSDAAGRKFVGGLAFDITERERAEEALRRSEERYRILVEKARDSIFTMNGHGHFASINDAFSKITGWKREEWIDRPFQEIVHDGDVARAVEYFQTVISGRDPEIFELRVLTREDGYIPMEFTVTPLWEEGRITGVLGIGRDVRERHLLEEQLRQMQKMESVGRLAAGVAHDFNNILTVLQGYVSLLQLEKGLSDSMREAVVEISNSTERASGLTRQLLLFSRKQALRPRTIDLNDLVDNVGSLLRRIVGEDIDLRIEKGESTPTVKADPVMMEQILLNLAVNSRDAMPQGGRLRISAEVWSPDPKQLRRNAEARPGTFARLTVADTGCGIPPGVREKLFEPFVTTKDIGRGTGLGLATVYGIVKQHDGWIEVESAPGAGTTFRIHLPLEKRADGAVPAAKRREQAVPASGGGKRVLVVEDEAPVREMVRMVLEKYGYEVGAAESGPRALALWEDRGGKFDLLLTDMVMPGGLTGGQLAAKLREMRPDLKIIFTSGYSAEIAGKDVGGDTGTAFLQKPYLPEDLIRLLGKSLAG